jgi:hypothetical protein
LLDKETRKSFEPPILGIAAEPVETILRFLEEKITSYNPKLHQHQTTKLTTVLIDIVRRFFNENSLKIEIPSIPSNYFKNHCLSNYQNSVDLMKTSGLIISKNSIEAYKRLISTDYFIGRLFNNERSVEIFELLDKVFTFVPLSPQQVKELRNQPQPREFYSFNISLFTENDLSVQTFLQYQERKPKPKSKPRKIEINNIIHVFPPLPPKRDLIKKYEFEEWMRPFYQAILNPLFQCNPEHFCQLVQYDGEKLGNILLHLQKNAKYIKAENLNTNILGHILNLLIEDLLIQEPVPTKNDPNPQSPQTLFRNEIGAIFQPVFPPIHAQQNQQNNTTSGLPQYDGTKSLLAYLCYVMGLPNIIKSLNPFIFSEKLIQLFSHPLNDLKKRLGDDNKYGFMNHLSNLVVSLVNFGSKEHQQDWARIESSTITPLIHILSCEIFCGSTLDVINKKLISSSNLKERHAIVTSIISILSQTNIRFPNSLQKKIVIWLMEARIVGSPLPQFSLDYIKSLSHTPRIHIDIRRTIASAIVAYFKYQAVSESDPIQFDELFEVLISVFNSSKVQLAPTFCQLIRPRFCRSLASSSPIYRDLLPNLTSPKSLVGRQFYREISMPRKGLWQEKYEKFISEFLGKNLLNTDQHVLQLTIQILTKIGIRGGNISSQIARFVTTSFEEFSVLNPSSILMNFVFSFCFSSTHQEYTEMIDSFVKIFSKARAHLDEVNNLQIKHVWLQDEEFDQKLYQPLVETFSIFEACFELTLEKFENSKLYHFSWKRMFSKLYNPSKFCTFTSQSASNQRISF